MWTVDLVPDGPVQGVHDVPHGRQSMAVAKVVSRWVVAVGHQLHEPAVCTLMLVRDLHGTHFVPRTTRTGAVGRMRCRPQVLVPAEVALFMEEISYGVREWVVAFLVVGTNSSVV